MFSMEKYTGGREPLSDSRYELWDMDDLFDDPRVIQEIDKSVKDIEQRLQNEASLYDNGSKNDDTGQKLLAEGSGKPVPGVVHDENENACSDSVMDPPPPKRVKLNDDCKVKNMSIVELLGCTPVSTQSQDKPCPFVMTGIQQRVFSAVSECRLTEEQLIGLFGGRRKQLGNMYNKLKYHRYYGILKKDLQLEYRIKAAISALVREKYVQITQNGTIYKIRDYVPDASQQTSTNEIVKAPLQTQTSAPNSTPKIHYINASLAKQELTPEDMLQKIPKWSLQRVSRFDTQPPKIASISVTTTLTPASESVVLIPKQDASQLQQHIPKPMKGSLPNIDNLSLSDQQKEVVIAALQGQSLFFTGAAGTGKSYVLREMVRLLKQMHGDASVFVTAPTGIAACNVNGCTIHAFSGVGLGKDPVDRLIAKIIKSPARKRWRSAKVLIIDEVSMLSGELFEKLDAIAKAITKCNRPFGGIQVILCGDFFQLPPVREGNSEPNYCFETAAWKKLVHSTFYLQTVYRQTDMEFIELLNEIRTGTVSDSAYQKLLGCVDRSWKDDISPTHLYPLKNFVETHNKSRLDQLEGDIYEFKAVDTAAEKNKLYMESLANSCPAPYLLQLKKGAQVILLKNIDVEHELFNGARGKVIDFERDHQTKQIYPVIEFESGRIRMIRPEKWSLVIGSEEVASREQLPLNLAWALSIHKAQGMTISRLEISLNKVFEDGQAYVALSRATSLEGLRIQGHFSKDVIRASKKVLEFYQSLCTQ